MTTTTENLAAAIERVTGKRRFCSIGHTAKTCAQENLSGRTHYCDEGTLRFFSSRIIKSSARLDGLVFVLVESVATGFRSSERGFRFVAFDLFGEVLNERAPSNNLRRTGAQARKDAAEWLSGFDVLAHYRKQLTERAGQLQREADETKHIADGI